MTKTRSITTIVALAALAGCAQTEDEKRMACLDDAARAPTAAGVALKKNLCLLEHPVKPGQLVNGDTNWTQFRPADPP